MVSIRAIESLHSLTNDIARIVDLAPSMAGGDSLNPQSFCLPNIGTFQKYLCEIPYDLLVSEYIIF